MTEDIENWIPAKGFEGFYEVSTFGRLRSLSRFVSHKKNSKRFVKGRIMKLCPNDEGYLKTAFTVNSIYKSQTAHIIIFYSFNPDVLPKKGYEVDHIDDDKSNNRPGNLRQIKQRENSTKRSLRYLNNTSKHTGVYFDKSRGKFMAVIKINCKTKNLGRFINEQDAADAYQSALKEIESYKTNQSNTYNHNLT